mgnify:CR=1 FL=1
MFCLLPEDPSSILLSEQRRQMDLNEDLYTRRILKQKIKRRDFQVILIDLSKRLIPLARNMLDTLKSISKVDESECIFEYASMEDCIDKLFEQKITYLFVSNRIDINEIKKRGDSIERIVILEDDTINVDYKQRFNNGVDLIFELADELNRCYKEEVEIYNLSGNVDEARKRNALADEIHPKLKIIFESMSKQTQIIMKPVTIVWFKRYVHTDEINHIQELIPKYASSFLEFNDELECKKYLCKNQSATTIFLIINEQSINLQDFPEIKHVYLKYDNLRHELISDLADWYYKSGSIYSKQKDPKQAKEMFIKSHELYEKLSTLINK